MVEEFPITWDNLQSSTCLIWNRFLNILHKPHIPNVKKRYNMVGRTIPWLHINRPDGALFSVKAAVSKASLFKRDNGKFMSSLILPCHKWFDYIFTDFPLEVVFREVQVMKTPFTTHQTFAKLVTQIFLSAIEL